jgi:hypothetical protein
LVYATGSSVPSRCKPVGNVLMFGNGTSATLKRR